MHRCMMCGGPVNRDGKYAEGGEVEPYEGALLEEVDPGESGMDYDGDEVRAPESRLGTNEEEGWELEQRQAVEGQHTAQQSATELMRDGAFATAYRRAQYARGGVIAGPGQTARPVHSPSHEANLRRVEPQEELPPSGGVGGDRSLEAMEPEDIEERRRAMAEKKHARYGFGGGR